MSSFIPKYWTINVRRSTAASMQVTYESKIRLCSNLQRARIQFPSGCQSLVLVTVKINGQPVLPYEGDALGYDASDPMDYPIEVEVDVGDILEYVVNNGDAANAHTIPCLFILQQRPQEPKKVS